MSAQHIEDTINVLYDLIQDARSVPLSSDKCILERDKALDLLDEILANMPQELKDSREIVESRNTLVAQARREAESIIQAAKKEAAMLVTKEAVFQETQRRCEEMMIQNQTRMSQLRKASNDYMDDAMRRTEEAIAQSLDEIRDTRMKFRALADAQENKGVAAPDQAE